MLRIMKVEHSRAEHQMLGVSKQQHTWDITDNVFPIIEVFDEFVEYATGYVKYAYNGITCVEARTHQSGWAARNANNHNQAILKKSCLGVLLCDRHCSVANGLDIVRVRPSICDKARKKQINQQCPNEGCQGRLYLKPCRGHSGYPVTHFWREIVTLDGRSTILFQAKGEHDHPRPERKSVAQRRNSKIMNENWTPCSLVKSVRRLKRLTNRPKRLTAITNNQNIKSSQPQIDVFSPGIESSSGPCYPAVNCHQSPAPSSWMTCESYHRPTVIRQPQTITSDSPSWPTINYRSQPIVPPTGANHSSYASTLPWCNDVINRQHLSSCSSGYNKSFATPHNPSSFCQQQPQYAFTANHNNNNQWITPCNAHNDVISGGFHDWNRSFQCRLQRPEQFDYDVAVPLSATTHPAVVNQF